GALDIVDTASLPKVKSIPLKNRLHDIVVTADGKYAVAGAPLEGKRAYFFDLKTEELAGELTFEAGVGPLAVEAIPNGRLFVQLSKLNGFVVIDVAKRQEI